MPQTTVQGSSVPFLISLDAGVTYKVVVCKKTAGVNMNRAITREETDCGSFVGTGSLTWNGSYAGLVSTTPTGASEMSYEDLLGVMVAGTQVLAKIQNPQTGTPGADWYIQGAGYLENLNIEFNNGSLVLFSFDFQGSGDPDVTV